MNPRLRIALPAVAVMILAALSWFWWTSTHEKQWFDKPVPVEGEASYNRFYVLQQALRAQGITVQSMPHLPGAIDHWSERDSLLLGSDVQTLSPEQVDMLLDWVGRGGRMILASTSDGQPGGSNLLHRIGIRPQRLESCFGWRISDRHSMTQCFAAFEFMAGERDNFQVSVGNDKDGWISARRNWGLGQIEVVGDFQPMRNEFLDTPGNVDWTWQQLAPMLAGGAFHIVYQTELPALYVYLVEYGWFALLPALIALLLWLWARSQRFGPPLPLPAPDRRALGEHVQASGEYLYRRGLVAALYAPLRRRFDEQLRRRDPELAALPVIDLAKILAERHRLSLDSVQQALRPPRAKQGKAFLSTVQTLLHLIRQP